MNNLRSLPLCVLASAFLCSAVALAQQAAPAVRIVNPIDETQLVTLARTVHPLANAANDRGAAPDGMQLDRLQLVLQRSPAQETALRQLIAQQIAPGSSNYHQWLTPDQFGAQFGASDEDIATIQTWLTSHGFSVTKVNPGKGTLEFSGNVAQMRQTFHTQIHKYVVNGEIHYANANNPQIPAALAPVIAGFSSLNNFHPKSYVKKLGEASMDPTTHKVSQWTWGTSSGVYFVLAPGDFTVQYDLQPLYTASVNGSGQTIAIINDSNINIDLVNQFRTLFSLPANPPQVIIDGNDPGVDGINNPDGPNYDSVEAYLDVEWSGAVAPDATIDLVTAADTSLQLGLFLAMEHAVYGNVAPVISLSFGYCEAGLGAYNGFINGLWEQAAAQGQTVMVSTGDSGSAGCDDANTQEYAVYGQAVNGFASTPYNVAVGGTDFFYSDYNNSGLDTQIESYWNPTTATQSPSVSIFAANAPIPEQPWNDSQYGLNAFNEYTYYGTTSIVAGGGGASNAALCSNNTYSSSTGECTGTMSGYAKPSWQTGAGVPADSARDIPDVSLFSANGDNYTFYPICATDGDCQTSGNPIQIYGVGGTSASSPSFAGIMALVNQKYGRQGQADNILYALKVQYPAAFHNVTNGTNTVPCEYAPTVTTNCISAGADAIVLDGITEGEIGTGSTPEYNAAAGYNLATGLGTIDANVLVTDWNKISLASTSTTMTASQTSFVHGTPITISGTVKGGDAPTGNVALMTDSTESVQQGQAVFPLSAGAYSSGATVNYLPGGTYHIWGQYSGDANYAMSTSTPPIEITVSPETPGMNFSLFNAALAEYFTPSSGPGTQVDYGSQLMLSALVAPTTNNTLAYLENCITVGTDCSQVGTFTSATGTVTFTDNGTTINTAVMNAEGDAEYNAPFAVGSHSVVANYNGDQSYNKVTSSAIPFTVVKDKPEFFWGASNLNSSGSIISGQPTVFNVIVENGAQYNACNPNSAGLCTAAAPVPVLPPSGTVTLSSTPGGISGTITLSSGVDPSDEAQAGIGTVTLASGLAAGGYTVTFTYNGDANYTGYSAQGTINVAATSGLIATTTTASMSGSISPNTTITVTGSVTGQSGHAAPTGGVIVFSSGTYLTGSSYLPFSSSSGDVSSFSFTLNSQDLVQGANFVTIQYIGDPSYAPSEYTLNSGNAIANPLADFSMVPQTSLIPVSVANDATDTIQLSSVNGFSGAVSLTCTAATGVTCSLVPASANLSSGSASAVTLEINGTSATAGERYNVLVTGKDSTGEFTHTLAINAVATSSAPGTATFAMSSGGAISVNPGATTGNTTTIYATPSNGFSGSVALTCSITPTAASDPATCGFSTSPLTLSGTTAQSSTLTITSTAATADLVYPKFGNGKGWLGAGGGAVLALVFFFGIPKKRRSWRSMLGILVAMVALGTLASCGGSSGGGGGTPTAGTTPGTYTVTVTGTSGSITQSTVLTLTVN